MRALLLALAVTASLHAQEVPHESFTLDNGLSVVLHQDNTLPQVVVVLVQGAAIAGGMGLTCCGDIVVVTEDALFSMTETQIGIVPAQIAPFVIARIGLPAARRLMLTGGIIVAAVLFQGKKEG